MDNIEELIKENGYTKNHIAKILGIHRNSLLRKIKGDITWKDEEIELLKKILKKD